MKKIETSASATSKKSTKKSTNSTKAVKTVEKKHLEKAAEKQQSKVSKYIYAADCTTAADRKQFRRKSRAAISTWEEVLKTGNKEEKAKAVKEMAAWKAKYFKVQVAETPAKA